MPTKTAGTTKTTKATKTTLNKTIAVMDATGKKSAKTLSLPQDIFGTKSSDRLLANSVRVYLTNKRSWSAVAQTRAEVTASKRKIYRQKGTGRARHGALSAHIFVGGGAAHGPKARDKRLRLNKKQIKQALFGALTRANQENRIIVLSDSILKSEPKTKKMEKLLKQLKIYGKKILLVYTNENSKNLKLASRNIENLNMSEAKSLNTYLLVSNEVILFTQDSLALLIKHFTKNEN